MQYHSFMLGFCHCTCTPALCPAGDGPAKLQAAVERLSLLKDGQTKMDGVMLPDIRLLALLFGEGIASRPLWWSELVGRRTLLPLQPGGVLGHGRRLSIDVPAAVADRCRLLTKPAT